jgi:hypothetical protein
VHSLTHTRTPHLSPLIAQVPLSDGTLRLLLRPQEQPSQQPQRPLLQSSPSPTAASAGAPTTDSRGSSLRHSAVRRWLSAGGSESADGTLECVDGSDTDRGAQARDQAGSAKGGHVGAIEGVDAAGGGKAGAAQSLALAAGRTHTHDSSSGGGDVTDDDQACVSQQHAQSSADSGGASTTWQVYNVMLPPDMEPAAPAAKSAVFMEPAAPAAKSAVFMEHAVAAPKLAVGTKEPAPEMAAIAKEPVAAPEPHAAGDDTVAARDAALLPAPPANGAAEGGQLDPAMPGAARMRGGAAGAVHVCDEVDAADAPRVEAWADGEFDGQEQQEQAQLQQEHDAQPEGAGVQPAVQQAQLQQEQEQQAQPEEAGVQQEQEQQRESPRGGAAAAAAASAAVRTIEGVVRLLVPSFKREWAYSSAAPLPPMVTHEGVYTSGGALAAPAQHAAPPQAHSSPGEDKVKQGGGGMAACSREGMMIHPGIACETAGERAGAAVHAVPRELAQPGGLKWVGGSGGAGGAAAAARAHRPSLIKRILRPCLCPSADTWELDYSREL